MISIPYVIRFANCNMCNKEVIVSCTDIDAYYDLTNEREDLEALGWKWVSDEVQYCEICCKVISSIKEGANDIRRTLG